MNEAEEPVKTGDRLGDLTVEIPKDRHIVSFVTAGPKSYSYMLDNGTSKVTVKGITMNSRNKKLITFDRVKDLVLGLTGTSSVQMLNPNSFTRNSVMGTSGIGPATKT